jgi:hypothetical protein
VKRCDGVTMSTGGETTLGRRNGGDDPSWADANLTGPKNEKNSRGQFSYFKWMMKI